TRIMPARNATVKVTGSRTVSTSGLQNSPGAKAHGQLIFSNSGSSPAMFSGGTPFMADNGIQVSLDDDVRVPPRMSGSNGMASQSATALEPGQAGNLQPGSFHSPNSRVTVINTTAFSGGSDTNVLHLVAQNDLDNVKKGLTPGL